MKFRFRAAWILAGLVPALWEAPPAASLAWAAALGLGAALAAGRPSRWVAVAWIAAAAVPGVQLAPVAAAGALLAGGRAHLGAAALGAALGAAAQFAPFVVPVYAGGALLLAAAAAIAFLPSRPGPPEEESAP